MALVRERLKQVLEGAKWQKGAHAGQQMLLTESIPPPKKSGRKQDICAFHIPIVCSSGKTMQMFRVSGANSRPPGRSQGLCAKPSMLYLGTGGVAGAGPRRGSLGRAVRALGGQPAAAVRVAEALAVLFADLREQNGHSVQHVCQPATGPRLKS